MENEDKPKEEVVSEATNSTAELVQRETPDGGEPPPPPSTSVGGRKSSTVGHQDHLHPPPQTHHHSTTGSASPRPTSAIEKRQRRYPLGARRVRRGGEQTRERCGRCGSHDIRTEFTTTGILLGVFCFPCGLICCLSMMEAACYNCGEPYPIDEIV